MFTQTATVNKFASRDQYGAITYSTVSTNYPCRRDYEVHLVADNEGHNVTAYSVVYVGASSSGGFPAITPEDKVVVGSTQPRIINVERLLDEFGNAYVEQVHCG